MQTLFRTNWKNTAIEFDLTRKKLQRTISRIYFSILPPQ